MGKVSATDHAAAVTPAADGSQSNSQDHISALQLQRACVDVPVNCQPLTMSELWRGARNFNGAGMPAIVGGLSPGPVELGNFRCGDAELARKFGSKVTLPGYGIERRQHRERDQGRFDHIALSKGLERRD